MRDLVDQMLAIVDRGSWSAQGNDYGFDITIAGTRIAFDTTKSAVDRSFEQLVPAIEAAIAVERASQMIEAAGAVTAPLPLWLVSGSHILGQWLHWAGSGNALCKVLTLTNEVGLAPVAGYLDRRNRWELGQGGARVRVRGGMAIAERIELSQTPRCTAILGQAARIRIETHALPDTLVAGLQRDVGVNGRRSLAEIVSHPFFTAVDLQIVGVANDGPDVVFEVDHRWEPLEPIPATARSVLPIDADPVCPWRATVAERRRLDQLVEEARHRGAATRDPR